MRGSSTVHGPILEASGDRRPTTLTGPGVVRPQSSQKAKSKLTLLVHTALNKATFGVVALKINTIAQNTANVK